MATHGYDDVAGVEPLTRCFNKLVGSLHRFFHLLGCLHFADAMALLGPEHTKGKTTDSVEETYWESIAEPFKTFAEAEKLYYSMDYLAVNGTSSKEQLKEMYVRVPGGLRKCIRLFSSLVRHAPQLSEKLQYVDSVLDEVRLIVESRLATVSLFSSLHRFNSTHRGAAAGHPSSSLNYEELVSGVSSIVHKIQNGVARSTLVAIKENTTHEALLMRAFFSVQMYLSQYRFLQTTLTLSECANLISSWKKQLHVCRKWKIPVASTDKPTDESRSTTPPRATTSLVNSGSARSLKALAMREKLVGVDRLPSVLQGGGRGLGFQVVGGSGVGLGIGAGGRGSLSGRQQIPQLCDPNKDLTVLQMVQLAKILRNQQGGSGSGGGGSWQSIPGRPDDSGNVEIKSTSVERAPSPLVGTSGWRIPSQWLPATRDTAHDSLSSPGSVTLTPKAWTAALSTPLTDAPLAVFGVVSSSVLQGASRWQDASGTASARAPKARTTTASSGSRGRRLFDKITGKAQVERKYPNILLWAQGFWTQLYLSLSQR